MIDSFTDALLKSLDAEGLVVVKKGRLEAAEAVCKWHSEFNPKENIRELYEAWRKTLEEKP